MHSFARASNQNQTERVLFNREVGRFFQEFGSIHSTLLPFQDRNKITAMHVTYGSAPPLGGVF